MQFFRPVLAEVDLGIDRLERSRTAPLHLHLGNERAPHFRGAEAGDEGLELDEKRIGGYLHARGTIDAFGEDGEIGLDGRQGFVGTGVGGAGARLVYGGSWLVYGGAVSDHRPALSRVMHVERFARDHLGSLCDRVLQQEGIKVHVPSGPLARAGAAKDRQHLAALGHGQPDALPVAVDHDLVRSALDDLLGQNNLLGPEDVRQAWRDTAGAVIAALPRAGSLRLEERDLRLLLEDDDADRLAGLPGAAEQAKGEERPGGTAAYDRDGGGVGQGDGAAAALRGVLTE